MKRIAVLPASLLLLLLAVTACCSDPDVMALATEAADTAPASSFNVVAKNTQFDTDTLVVIAGEETVVRLDNQDGALHNVAVYTEEGGDPIYRGELFTGPETREYRFQSPQAGVYYFRCDAHPEMEGVFIAR